MDEADEHFSNGETLKGVMVGRGVVSDPFHWRNVDSRIYGEEDVGYTRREILTKYATYSRKVELSEGPDTRHSLVKPIYHLFAGCKNGKKFRHILSETIKDSNISVHDIIMKASDGIGHDDILDSH